MTALELFFLLLNLIISLAGLSAFALAATISEQNATEPEVIELGEMKIINLTPHDIHLHLAGGEVVTYPALNKDAPARAAMEVTNVGFVNVNGQKIPITRNKYGELENVPYPEPNTFFYCISSCCTSRSI